MKGRFILALVIFLSLAFSNISDACTNLIVTKGASKDGSVMITYSADSYNMFGELYHFKAAVYSNGAMLDVYEWDTGKFLMTIPQADVTYNVVGNINEHQVALGETTFVGRHELVNEEGLDYGSLMYIALQRAKTAREAIKIMTSLAAEHGYCSSGESFSVTDANEAWIMEMIGKGEGNKGAVWVARRIPDGYISGHANQARITTFPLNDPENCLYSDDVISFAREKGYFNGEDSEFDFAQAYNPLDFGGIRFCDARVWTMFRRVNKEMDKFLPYIKGESLERMPLWIKPDQKVSVHDVMTLMRDHYEGTELDMNKGILAGLYASPYRCTPLVWKVDGESYFNERPISTYQTGFSFVTQSRSHLPREIGGVIWFGMDDTYMTVYTPMYASMTEIPYNYQEGLGSLTEFNWDSAFWVFNWVSNFAYPRYSLIIDDIRKKQNELEGQYLKQQKNVEETAQTLLKKSHGEAVQYLTDYSVASGNNTYSTWKKFGESLMWRYNDGVVKDQNGKMNRVGYPEAMRRMEVAQNGEALKMIEINTDTEYAYSEKIRQGDECLVNKDYSGAKKYFEEAVELKPAEVYPKEKIEKIKTMLSALEEMHKEHFSN